MNKKTLVIALVVALCFGLVLGLGIAGYKKGDIEPESNILGNKYIDLVTIYIGDKDTEVLYDKNTKVMYFVKRTGYQFGITPIYNSDGTVKLYDGE